jgi:prepilin peptidase CpaA
MDFTALFQSAAQNWPIWFLSIVLIVAAVIDGMYLKVPNNITFPLIVSGWGWSLYSGGPSALGWSVLGTFVGFSLLYFLHAIGGMGGGDVKLLGAIGAWVYTEHVWNIFVATTIVGAIMAVIMVAWSGRWNHHFRQAIKIVREWCNVRNPDKLYDIATERKPSMLLLPYGIPMTIAALGYFAYCGMYLG